MNKQKKYIDEVLEEFDEKILFRIRCEHCKKLPTNLKLINFKGDLYFNVVVRDFIKQKLREVKQNERERIETDLEEFMKGTCLEQDSIFLHLHDIVNDDYQQN